MLKVEGGGGPIDPPPLKASCNYFFFEASRDKSILKKLSITNRVIERKFNVQISH